MERPELSDDRAIVRDLALALDLSLLPVDFDPAEDVFGITLEDGDAFTEVFDAESGLWIRQPDGER